MRRILPLTACLLALAPAAAGAATRHVVRGAAWGHGIGFSQYGGQGMALNGHGYREILRHYYRGTDISDAPTKRIRVLLMSGQRSISFAGATKAHTRRLSPNRTYVARAISGGRIEVRSSGGRLAGRFAAPLRVKTTGEPIRLGGRAMNGIVGGQYRGWLELRPSTSGGTTVVNAVALDDYVQGVVPDEMPPSWHLEALKAQALAARSYALATDAGGPVFDQYPDTRSQVYGGVNAEEPSTNTAVQATRNEVVTYQGAVATTFFFSTSGGHTENNENVFYGGAPRPYLRGVEDPYDNISPRHRWRFEFSQSQMQSRLSGLVRGTYQGVEVVERGVSPRIVWADVVGSSGRTRVRGATLRQRLGLYDSWATFTAVTTSSARVSLGKASVLLGKLAGRPAVEGRFDPAPRRRVATVERRVRGGWKAARRGRLDGAGGYRIAVPRAGTYRVRVGAVAGPAVRVR
jgi:stage II sporulation protein D